MSIQAFTRLKGTITPALSLALLVALTDVPALARGGGDAAVRIINQEVRIEGDVALISYDLEAPEGGTYIVTVELRRESDPDFSLVPASLTGDIGELKSAGPHKLVRWEYLRDFPIGFRGEDFYFQIEVTKSGGIPWLWVGLGSAAVAGTVVALMAHKSASAPTPVMGELPMPPAR